jgi:hypothetical protein
VIAAMDLPPSSVPVLEQMPDNAVAAPGSVRIAMPASNEAEQAALAESLRPAESARGRCAGRLV